MKQILLSLTCMLFLTLATKAQSAKNIYAEIGGPGLASINYDMRLTSKDNGLGFRAGLGGFSIDGSKVLFVPVGLNYLLGKDGKHYLELGAGASFVSANDDTFDSDTFNSTFGHLTFGYRVQPSSGGFTFRAAINPVFGRGFFLPYYGGLSFGYRF